MSQPGWQSTLGNSLMLRAVSHRLVVAQEDKHYSIMQPTRLESLPLLQPCCCWRAGDVPCSCRMV
jgi:hypothetical protein